MDGVAPDMIASKNRSGPDLNSAATLEAPVRTADPRSEEEIQLEKAIQVLVCTRNKVELERCIPDAKRAA